MLSSNKVYAVPRTCRLPRATSSTPCPQPSAPLTRRRKPRPSGRPLSQALCRSPQELARQLRNHVLQGVRQGRERSRSPRRLWSWFRWRLHRCLSCALAATLALCFALALALGFALGRPSTLCASRGRLRGGRRTLKWQLCLYKRCLLRLSLRTTYALRVVEILGSRAPSTTTASSTSTATTEPFGHRMQSALEDGRGVVFRAPTAGARRTCCKKGNTFLQSS